MAGNAGFRMLSLSSGASIGAYAMSRTLRDARDPRRRDERALRGAAHAAERRDGPRRAPRRRGRRPRREPDRGASSWRSARTLVLAPLLGLAMIAERTARRRFVRRRRRHRRGGRGVHRRRRADGAALAAGAWRQRAGHGRAGRRLPRQRRREHARRRGRRRDRGRPAPGRAGSRRSAGATRCARSAATTGGCSPCSPPSPASCSSSPAGSPSGATSAPACSPSGRAAPRPPPRSAGRSGWPGACSARPSSAGWSALVGFGLIFGSVSRERADHGRQRAGDVPAHARHRPDARRLVHHADRDGRHGRRHLRRAGAAAHARGGGPRPARARPRERREQAALDDELSS